MIYDRHYLDFTVDKTNVSIYDFCSGQKLSENMFLSWYPHQSHIFWANWYVETDNPVPVCEQDDNSDNNEEEEDTNLSKVTHYQIADDGGSVVYTSWWL